MERQAEAVESAARGEDPEVASDVRNMLQQMKRDELEQKMEDSDKALENGWLDYAERLEDEIETSMDRMATQMQELQEQLPQTDEEQLRRALADLQNIRERLEAMQRQSQSSPSSGDPSSQGESSERSDRARESRMQREMERAQEAMERLENQLGGNEGMQRELQRAQNALRNVADASFRGILLDDENAKNFFNKDLFQPFSELESQLARELDTIEMEKKLFGARKAEVPDEYRDTVDRYYESLSKSNDN